MKNKELIFHIPRENKEDFQSIMDSVDTEEVYEAERKMRELEFKRKDSMSDNGILNDMDSHIEPKKLIYSNEMLYAFIWGSNEYALWTTNLLDLKRDEDWTEVTSLLDIPVFSYQELKNYAVAIGWIDEDNHNWLIEGR